MVRGRRGVPDVDPAGVLPTMGSKELVAWLPSILGLGPGDVVAFPTVAYPTYDVGARLAGATPLPIDALTALGPPTTATTPKLLWLNTPSNPTGKVLGIEHLTKVVEWARRHGVVVASDECYAELDWRPRDEGATEPPTTPSILDPRVTGGSHEGLLCVYSLSKQSNLAGYRAAFVAGDPALVRRLLEVRKHAGMMMPWPVQRSMVAALADVGHVQDAEDPVCRPPPAVGRRRVGVRTDHRGLGGRAVPLGHRRRGRLGDGGPARGARHPGRTRRPSTGSRGRSTSASHSPPPTSASRQPLVDCADRYGITWVTPRARTYTRWSTVELAISGPRPPGQGLRGRATDDGPTTTRRT